MPSQPTNMNTGHPFEQALIWLKGGRKITRAGWNGKGMYCYLVSKRSESVFAADEDTAALVDMLGEGAIIELEPRVDMRYASGKFGVWSPTIEDLLANDWRILT